MVKSGQAHVRTSWYENTAVCLVLSHGQVSFVCVPFQFSVPLPLTPAQWPNSQTFSPVLGTVIG